ncbi:MAG: glycerophosphodiester phosphodiesterase [Candidatus Hodarchaeota archaeon]
MTLILAHRGYLINGDPENSIPAFQTAIHFGADGLEFDIHLTLDRKLVCYHDDTLSLLGRSDFIKNLHYHELKTLELSEGIYIPSLEEILEEFGNKTTLNIELKTQKNGAKELSEIINQYSLTKDPNRLIVSSFHHIPLKEIKKIDPEIPTGLLFEFARGKLEEAQRLGCDAIHPYYGPVPKNSVRGFYPVISSIHKYYAHKCIEESRKLKILANPYGVNNERFLKSAIKKGVNGIITDNVEEAIEIRKKFDD